MRLPMWIRQALGDRPNKQWKQPCLPPLPSSFPLPNPPVLNELDRALPPERPISPGQRVKLFQALTPADLCGQIGGPDIALRVREVLVDIGNDSWRPREFPGSITDSFGGEASWTHCHALTWFARRFRPLSYLEISADPGKTLAMIAMNSCETKLVSLVPGRRQSLGWPHFQLAQVIRELARCGCHQPLTVVSGDGHGSFPRGFPAWRLRSRVRAQPRRQEFELIFVDGSCGRRGMYRDLKNAFARCALGGMVVFRGKDQEEASLPGKYCPRLHGFWERLPVRFPGFRYLKALQGIEVGVAFRTT